ncbi:MAG: RDD family protein [Rubrivivax sp.]|nr:RDD family protein [Rubrivivax sp.]
MTAAAASAEVAPGALQTPGLGRRLACFLYEGVLLFGVVVIAALLYATLTEQRHALVGSTGLQWLLFIVLGAYFVGFWSRTGQTLAMLTWKMRLVTREGLPVSRGRALCRYLLAWMWFAPALLGLHLAGLKAPVPTFVALFAGVLAYAGLSWLHPDRQYWHDAVCGTRLVTWRPVVHP